MGIHAGITEEGKENLFIHSLIQAISIAPLQVNWYLLALPTLHGYSIRHSVRVPSRSATE